MPSSVSVVTASRNRPQMLERALTSIARQSFSAFNVFVVDDGSSSEHADAYRSIVSGFGERFHLLQPLRAGETGSGPSASRNRGMAAGQDPYIAFIDDDDFWTWDQHLETAVSALEEHRGEFYCAEMQGFRGDTLVLDRWFTDARKMMSSKALRENPPVFSTTRAAFLHATGGRIVHPNMLVISRELLRRAGEFNLSLRFGEDWEFVVRLLDHVEMVLFSPQVVARYRLPEAGSLSSTWSRTAAELQTLSGAQHVRVSARSQEVRAEAARVTSWSLRSLSRMMKEEGRSGLAVSLAVEAFVARPSLGGARHVVQSLLPGGRGTGKA